MIQRIGCTTVLVLLFGLPRAGAQNADYVLSMSDETIALGSSGGVLPLQRWYASGWPFPGLRRGADE